MPRFRYDAAATHFAQRSFLKRHSLSVIATCITLAWLIGYLFTDPDNHLGAFFGNAIADWTGLVMTVIGTKFLFEKGSRQSRRPHDKGLPPVRKFIVDHSLTIFLLLSGTAWLTLFLMAKPTSKWGQVVGNIVSEWTQLLGLVLLTKKFVEPGSKE